MNKKYISFLRSANAVSSSAMVVYLLIPIVAFIPQFVHASAIIMPNDSFGASESNTVTGWTDSDGGGTDARIKTSQDRSGSPTKGHARLRLGASITKSIDTTSYQNIVLKYYWRGDHEAESSDKLRVYWRAGGNGDFNEITPPPSSNPPHSLDIDSWSSQIAVNLPDGANHAANLAFHRKPPSVSSGMEYVPASPSPC